MSALPNSWVAGRRQERQTGSGSRHKVPDSHPGGSGPSDQQGPSAKTGSGPSGAGRSGSPDNGGKPTDKPPRKRRRNRRRRRKAPSTDGVVANADKAAASEASSKKIKDNAAETSDGQTPTDQKRKPGRGRGSRNRGPGSRGRAGGRSNQRRRPQRGRFAHTYAALDLGTNNCRLLIARPQEEGFKIIDAFSRTVRLGQGLSTEENGEGALTEEAMDRAVDALQVCADKMKRRGVSRARCIATEACRTALNGATFVERVKEDTGLSLEIITPEREASLAVSGCAPLLDRECDAAMVFDIGGGSTELVWLDLSPLRSGASEPKILTWTSLPFGVVTLAETYLDRMPQTQEDELILFEELVARVRTEIENFEGADHQRDLYNTSKAHLIGNSGTVTTLAAVHLGLRAYDRRKVDGLWVNGTSLYELVSELSAMGFDGRADIPSVGQDRADLLFPGCAILRAIQDTWPSDRIRVADRGLREGILVELMEEAEKEGRRKRRTRRGRRGGRRRNQDNGGAKDPKPDQE